MSNERRPLPEKRRLTYMRFEYLWQDNENYKKPTKMPAPTYIEHLMAWVQGQIDNEAVFPSRIGDVFVRLVCTILIRNRRSISKTISIDD